MIEHDCDAAAAHTFDYTPLPLQMIEIEFLSGRAPATDTLNLLLIKDVEVEVIVFDFIAT